MGPSFYYDSGHACRHFIQSTRLFIIRTKVVRLFCAALGSRPSPKPLNPRMGDGRPRGAGRQRCTRSSDHRVRDRSKTSEPRKIPKTRTGTVVLCCLLLRCGIPCATRPLPRFLTTPAPPVPLCAWCLSWFLVREFGRSGGRIRTRRGVLFSCSRRVSWLASPGGSVTR